MSTRHPDLKLAQEILAAQPFNAQVGARVIEFTPGRATLELDIEDRHRQQFGLVHGGVLAYLADNVLTFAGGSVLGTSVITAGFTIRYLRPARDGLLRAVAVVADADDREAGCTAEIRIVRHGEETVCATAEGTIRATRRSD